MVISGGNFKPDTLKPKEVVSLLLDDEEIEMKCTFMIYLFKYRSMTYESLILHFTDRQRKEERKSFLNEETNRIDREKERKRKATVAAKEEQIKRSRSDGASASEISSYVDSSEKNSPAESLAEPAESIKQDDSSNEDLVVDCESPSTSSSQSIQNQNTIFEC